MELHDRTSFDPLCYAPRSVCDRRKSYATQSYMIIYHLILDVMHLAPPVAADDTRAEQAGLGKIEDAIPGHPSGVLLHVPR